MSIIKVNDLNFKLIINSEQIQAKVREIALHLERKLIQNNDIITLVIMDGAFIFAADLFRYINLEMQPKFIKIKSYLGETQSTEILIDHINIEIFKNKTIIIIEDIIDSGNSMFELITKLKAASVKEIYLVAMIIKSSQIRSEINVDLFGYNLGPEFIIGYGMDYQGCGRGLQGIYQKMI
ncbi:MAG: hypothetical protein IPQ02_20225 [Saprospiraceae bacterium]|nr:hypothetical protein [Candidatus Defluviibacterium haderslevense]